jgi:hypothetical protein
MTTWKEAFMRKMRGTKRVAAIAAVLALAAAGIATAYWTQGGGGTGSAGTGTTTSIVVHQTSPVAGLYPGGPAVTLSGNFDNSNAGPVFVTAVTAVVDPLFSARLDLSKPACTPGDFVIAGAAPVGASIPSGNAVGAWTGLTIQLQNLATNQDNCKNVTVPIIYTAS